LCDPQFILDSENSFELNKAGCILNLQVHSVLVHACPGELVLGELWEGAAAV